MVNARLQNNDFALILMASNLCGNWPHDAVRAPAGCHDCTNHGHISAILLPSGG
jgi:hypothetical protein